MNICVCLYICIPYAYVIYFVVVLIWQFGIFCKDQQIKCMRAIYILQAQVLSIQYIQNCQFKVSPLTFLRR